MMAATTLGAALGWLGTLYVLRDVIKLIRWLRYSSERPSVDEMIEHHRRYRASVREAEHA